MTKPLTPKARELALDVLTNAIETDAISHWTTNRDWTRNDGADGEMIDSIQFEILDEDTLGPVEPRIVHHITPEKIIDAMERIAVERLVLPELHKVITGMWATNDYLAGRGGDSETDDAIVQIAALGQITFG